MANVICELVGPVGPLFLKCRVLKFWFPVRFEVLPKQLRIKQRVNQKQTLLLGGNPLPEYFANWSCLGTGEATSSPCLSWIPETERELLILLSLLVPLIQYSVCVEFATASNCSQLRILMLCSLPATIADLGIAIEECRPMLAVWRKAFATSQPVQSKTPTETFFPPADKRFNELSKERRIVSCDVFTVSRFLPAVHIFFREVALLLVVF